MLCNNIIIHFEKKIVQSGRNNHTYNTAMLTYKKMWTMQCFIGLLCNIIKQLVEFIYLHELAVIVMPAMENSNRNTTVTLQYLHLLSIIKEAMTFWSFWLS